MLFAAAIPAAAQEPARAVQQRIKAVFLYKFASYVDWPAEVFSASGTPIGICVAGSDDLSRDLDLVVDGRQVANRPILIQRLQRGDALASCHILFLGADNDPDASRDLLQAAQALPVLTVTESEGGLPSGAVINFLAIDDRIRFDISREAADRKRLQVRSQLFGVARRVLSP